MTTPVKPTDLASTPTRDSMSNQNDQKIEVWVPKDRDPSRFFTQTSPSLSSFINPVPQASTPSAIQLIRFLATIPLNRDDAEREIHHLTDEELDCLKENLEHLFDATETPETSQTSNEEQPS